MRIFLSLLLLLSALPLAFSSVSSYTVANWLSVSMDVQYSQGTGCAGSVTGACGSTGAILPPSGPSGTTTVTLSLKNAGQTDREGVEISQDLSFVPSGSQVSFANAPSASSQSEAAWGLGSMKKGESKTIAYSFGAKLAAEPQIPRISAKSSPPQATITAPQSAKPGEKLEIYAKSPSGSSLAGVEIAITFPDGTSKKATTDPSGKAIITASKEGFYTYSVEGYALSGLSSTEVKKPQEAVPVAAASAGLPAKVVSFLSSLAPLLAAIFVAAVVVFILYGFITQKKEPGHAPSQEEPSPSAASQQALPLPHSPLIQPTFSSQQDSPQQLDTRRLVELRKSQMWQSEKTYSNNVDAQSAEKTAQHEEKSHMALPNLVHREEKPAQPTEKTYSRAESEPHMIALRSISSQEGESTFDESELEKTVRQLEEIRQKLRERKVQMEAMESVHSAYVGKLSEERKAAKAASRGVPTKSVKLAQKKRSSSKKRK